MAEGYLSQGGAQPPQQGAEQATQATSQKEPATKLAVNAMKVMYSDEVWPDIESFIKKGPEGCIDAVVMIAVNILDLAKHKNYQPSDDELMDAAEDLVDDVVQLGLNAGSLQGEKEDLMAQILIGAITQIDKERPGMINIEALQAVAAQASPEEQAKAQQFAPQGGQPPAQPQSQPQQQMG